MNGTRRAVTVDREASRVLGHHLGDRFLGKSSEEIARHDADHMLPQRRLRNTRKSWRQNMTSSGREPRGGIPDFSVLCDSHSKGAVILQVKENVNRFALLKGQLDETRPVDCHPGAGRRWFDLVAMDTVVSYAILGRFRAALREAGASGWHTRKIDVDGIPVEDHELLVVTGRCGPVDDKRSAFEVRQNKSGVGYPVWTGLFFDPAAWDGADVFCPSDSGMIFITEPICEAIRRAKIENVLLRRGIDFERNAL